VARTTPPTNRAWRSTQVPLVRLERCAPRLESRREERRRRSSTAGASRSSPSPARLGTDWAQRRELCPAAAERTRGLAGIIRRPEPSMRGAPHRTGRWGLVFRRICHLCRDFTCEPW
jgi:hypothetical protein